MSDAQKLVQEAVGQLVEWGTDTGLQVAVYQHGELVVDAVAGVADSSTGRPVTPGTPFYSASTGKGVTSTVAHVLVERGALDYDTPIVELWPEFGAHGKENATLRHVLTHTVGVPGGANCCPLCPGVVFGFPTVAGEEPLVSRCARTVLPPPRPSMRNS